LLGKVTEVGLFTDKIEIKKDELTDTELDQRIKDKLSKFMGVVDILEVTDADPIEAPAPAPAPAPTPEPDEA